jgi:NADH-quinone oxidoreductase subunit F
MRITDLSSYNAAREAGLAKLLPTFTRISIGMGTCGSGNGAEAIYHAFSDAIETLGLGYKVASTGCFGFCAEEPLVNVYVPGKPLLILNRVQQNDVAAILDEISEDCLRPDRVLCKIEDWDHITGHVRYGSGYREIPHWYDVPFFKGQKRSCSAIAV